MKLKTFFIICLIAGGVLWINGCTCDNWFNNGCQWNETLIGGLF